MFKKLAELFSSADDRAMKARWRSVAAINAIEAEATTLSDDQLRSRTAHFRMLATTGTSLDKLLVPAFATVREASRRVLGMRHFDVQLLGGAILHEGAIAEMRTGEGKTLVATLAAYLNALDGKGVHVVTVNDYLARRDSETMGKIHALLGLSVGLIVSGMDDDARRAAYAADITYGTNSEIGFDHLRDNLKLSQATMVQRGFNYAIVDEVDSILIDEARNPLVISGEAQDHSGWYRAVDAIIPRLAHSDYEIDEKTRSVSLTDHGLERAEALLAERKLLAAGHLFDIENAPLSHHVNAALKAHLLFQRDRHYIVRDGEVVIVDEFTGRTMIGRRFNDGLHQAIEAKERVSILAENETIASITYQGLFRSYRKLSGMTGTAMTEAEEFAAVYGLRVVPVPTNRPVRRDDQTDEIYLDETSKIDAIVAEIEQAHARLQPLLVGTASIEKSEALAARLEREGFRRLSFEIPADLAPLYEAAASGTPPRLFAVLNAKSHQKEAAIIAQAGVPGAITIATNMAGRGTDIQLGGNAIERLRNIDSADDDRTTEAQILLETDEWRLKAIAGGGLYVIGTERSESRRIDNQLRGRSGRQGDPGRSKFFLALSDDILRIFGNIGKLAEQMELKPGEAIAHPFISKAVERAQRRIEHENFERRRQLVRFDQVIDAQRRAILEERTHIMASSDVRDIVDVMRNDWLDQLVEEHISERSYPEQWPVDEIGAEISRVLHVDLPLAHWAAEDGMTAAAFLDRLRDTANTRYADHVARNGDSHTLAVEKMFLLQILDFVWREQIEYLDHLKVAVGWRSVGQRDPFMEFSADASTALESAMARWGELVTCEVNREPLLERVA